jgi:uncharacterized protein YdaU (DUF1376 family)
VRHGADWYKREPTAYLGGVQGMTAKEHAVYSIILDLIYQHGGSVNNDPSWIAGWISDMGPAAVRGAIAALIGRGKLTQEGDQITNARAKSEAKTKENLSESRAKTGKKGGISSGKSRSASNKNNNISEAIASPREEKSRVEEKREAKASPKSRGTRLPASWVLPREFGEWALSEGWAESAIRAEADKFKDYWTARAGRDAAKLDWLATWRNWLRNSKTPKLSPITGGHHGQSSSKSAARLDAFVSGARGAS